MPPFRQLGLPVAVGLILLVASCSSDGSGELTTGQTASAASQGAETLAPVTAEPPTTTTLLPPTTTAPPTTTVAPTIEECLDYIPLRVRLGQLLFPVLIQAELGQAVEHVANGDIAGVVVLGNPTSDLQGDLAALQDASLIGPSIVAVDEEGGRVQRVAELVGELPSARALAADYTIAQAQELHRAHALLLADLGFTMNLAPVIDLDNGTYIGNRSFSSENQVVVDYGMAVADGILDAGLVPVAKHFPGHGRGTDSHKGLPELPELDVLRADDLVPFGAAIAHGDIPIMVGHLVVPDLTNGQPATLSPEAVTGLLRDEMGFDGVIMTDALNMDAITLGFDGATAAEQALIAGVDLVMLGTVGDIVPTLDRLETAVSDGVLSEVSVNASFLRVMEIKGVNACDIPADEEPAIRCQEITTGGCALS